MDVRSFSVQAALALAFVVLTALSSGAQTPPAQPRIPGESFAIGWGLKSGLQWPSTEAVGDGYDHLGGMIGALVDFNQRKPVGVAAEVLLVNLPESGIAGFPSGRLHLLEVPVLVRLRAPLSEGNRYAVYGVAGPALNFKLSGDVGYKDRTVDVVVGGGVELKDISVEARIKRGSRDRVLAGVTESYTQQALSILVGFRMKP